jgi:phosphoserine aminotransferase
MTTTATPSNRICNFSAGPSALPLPVLEEASQALIDYAGTGVGIAEISHRSSEFAAITSEFEHALRTLLDVPATHTILFAQGGGTAQFSAVVLNLLARHVARWPDAKERVLEYVLTGSWSRKAAEEASKLVKGCGGAAATEVHVVVDTRELSQDGKSFDRIPPHAAYTFSAKNPVLIYYCDNETVDGVQFADGGGGASFPFDHIPEGAALVADHSSSFLSRPIAHIARHAVIFAGAQKNLGPAGTTVIIVRNDCLLSAEETERASRVVAIPVTLDYATMARTRSLYNTPSVFSVYVCTLVLRRMLASGLARQAQESARKARKLYAVLEEGVRAGRVRVRVQEGSRSAMNVVFEILGEEGALQKRFLEEAERRGMRGLKGHR